jgi:hypothetical protein
MDPFGAEHEPVVVEQTGNFNIVAKLDSDFELLTHNVASAELYRDILEGHTIQELSLLGPQPF